MARDAPKQRENFEAATKKAFSKQDAAITVAMKAVFWLAKECIPMTKYTSLIEFLKYLKVPDIDGLSAVKRADYSSYHSAVDLLKAVSDEIDDKVTEQINSSPVITIMCDESTDILVHHKLAINCRIVDPVSLAPKTLFLSDLRINDGTGKGIFESLKAHLATRGVSVKKVDALGTDGASVMTGKKEGLLGQFLRVNPHMVNTHCAAHRLALCTEQAGKKIPAVTEFASSVEQIYYHFKRSPHKSDMMEEIQKVLNDPVLKYREIHQIRWLSFNDALTTVVRTLDSLLTYFCSTAQQDPKSVGMKKRLGTEMFVLLSHGLLDILRPVMKLSLVFQRQDLDIGCVKVEIDGCISDLAYLKDSTNPLNKPTYVSMAKQELQRESNGKLSFKGHHISKMTSKTQFQNVFNQYIDAIVENIVSRFPDTELMTCMGVLAMRPITFLCESELEIWGDESLEVLLKHYGSEKTHTYKDLATRLTITTEASPPRVDAEECRREWKKLKRVVVAQQYPRQSMASLWSLIMQYHSSDCPQLSVLAAMALAHPIHTADCERTFSSQNHIMSPLRNRLSSEHCDELMRVMLQGGNMQDFPFHQAVSRWASAKQRVIYQAKETGAK